MKEVKTQKRYKCDFCKKRGIRKTIGFHEGLCFRNPNRFCPHCKNTGKVPLSAEGFVGEYDCLYCERFNPQQLKEIEEREAKYEV